ncbi:MULTISPECIES: hypothetical protein [Haloferax]|nr:MULTISPECIES: hypothetical protein [Haloferax]
MREFEVTCPECGQHYRVNEPMYETLQKTGCVMCKAPVHDGVAPA